MSFRRPVRASPVKLGDYYRAKQRVTHRNAALKYLGFAALAGATVGFGSILFTESGRAAIWQTAKRIAVATRHDRARMPQVGDNWGGCNDARAVGTAPIYYDEPGYRENMDGHGDGIACEPYYGN